MAKQSKMTVQSTYDEETGVTEFVMTFANDAVRNFTLSPSDSLFNDFAQHGAEQKIRDKIASCKDADESVAAIDQLLGHLTKGEWGAKRSAGEGPKDSSGLLVKALASLSGKPVEEVQATVGALDKKQQAALRSDPVVAAEMDKFRKPKAAPKGVDLEALKAAMGL
jgi:hypothetical protein